MQSTSLRAPTRYEQERITAMLRLGCCACAVLGIPFAEVQCHHILDGGVRMGHWFTLPVCAGHHKGEFTPVQRALYEEIALERGISVLVAIHTGRKPFARVYGTEKQLWSRVQERLKLPAVWPTSKILPRRSYGDVDTLRISGSEHGAHLLGDRQLRAVPGSDGQLGGPGMGVGDSVQDTAPVSTGDVLPGEAV